MGLSLVAVTILAPSLLANDVDEILGRENLALEVEASPVAVVDDLTYLRRVSVDLIGRIPTGAELRDYMDTPAEERRSQLVDRLLADERFADRWTTFMADLLRIRSTATGGAALTAYVHQAIQSDMPYDELCRRLISANGKANTTPEVGFILGDDANPTAMAAVTAQVFLGVRISCAECHDHPFDVWTRNDFYSLAAFFGKTRLVESQITNVVYTTEDKQTTILWPPEDAAEANERKPLIPRFPFEIIAEEKSLDFIARFIARRNQEELARQAASKKTNDVVIDELLSSTADKVKFQGKGKLDALGVRSEAKSSIRQIDIQGSLYRESQLRLQLAELITSPRNRLFARSFVNRLWKELIGTGFVEPIDDFRSDNLTSHPKTLNFLAEEFVANGYDLRTLVRLVVTSEAYARGHVATEADAITREKLESHFLATPMRRMLGEALFDSIVVAGHLFEYKHPAGANEKTVQERVRVRVAEDGNPLETPIESTLTTPLIQTTGGPTMETAMSGQAMQAGGYALEAGIELDFTALLEKKDGGLEVEQMQIMSAEELAAQRMAMEAAPQDGAKYVMTTVERVFDDNPRFNSTFRMASPAPAGHFVRVFGQTDRQDLGDIRNDTPNMRQALMMLNGRLTHEASRVGPLEPLHKLLDTANPNIDKAIQLAYYEILTRAPTTEELSDGNEIIAGGPTLLEGMADLRWVLLNCNEFRFLP